MKFLSGYLVSQPGFEGSVSQRREQTVKFGEAWAMALRRAVASQPEQTLVGGHLNNIGPFIIRSLIFAHLRAHVLQNLHQLSQPSRSGECRSTTLWDYQGRYYDDHLLGSGSVLSGRFLLTFWGYVLPPSSRYYYFRDEASTIIPHCMASHPRRQ
jgi:hypothetical protein